MDILHKVYCFLQKGTQHTPSVDATRMHSEKRASPTEKFSSGCPEEQAQDRQHDFQGSVQNKNVESIVKNNCRTETAEH